MLAIAFTAALSAVAAQPATLDALAFLAGSWEGEDGGMTAETTYSEPRAGVVLGYGRYMADGALAFYEFETFRLDGDTIVLTPSPFGQPGVSFRATLVEPGHVVFENLAHDFPSIIEYRLLPDGTLYSRAAGTENGEASAFEYVQRKKDN